LADLGCHIQGTYIGCLVYADYIILLSASVGFFCKRCWISVMSVAQKLILFLTQKSLLFVVDKAYDVTIEDLKISHDTISWSDRLKYLGVHFKSGRTC